MKNIHVLTTDKPSKLFYLGETLSFTKYKKYGGVNIYITCDEDIIDKCYVLYETKIGKLYLNNVLYLDGVINTASMLAEGEWKKIILTTDQDLINDGVQDIDDVFLEWFVKNPTCEEVKIFLIWVSLLTFEYEIIIPNEETKQCEHDIIEEFTKEVMDYSKIDIQGSKIADEMYKDIENTVERIDAKLAFYNGFINALKLVEQELKIAESKETE